MTSAHKHPELREAKLGDILRVPVVEEGAQSAEHDDELVLDDDSTPRRLRLLSRSDLQGLSTRRSALAVRTLMKSSRATTIVLSVWEPFILNSGLVARRDQPPPADAAVQCSLKCSGVAWWLLSVTTGTPAGCWLSTWHASQMAAFPRREQAFEPKPWTGTRILPESQPHDAERGRETPPWTQGRCRGLEAIRRALAASRY